MTAVSDAQLAGFLAQRRVAGVTITIGRAGQDPIEVLAVPGRSMHESQTETGQVLQTQARDYHILAADYDFGAGPVLPERFDTATEGGVTYTVLSLGGDAQFRYMDQGRAILRVHYKETA